MQSQDLKEEELTRLKGGIPGKGFVTTGQCSWNMGGAREVGRSMQDPVGHAESYSKSTRKLLKDFSRWVT